MRIIGMDHVQLAMPVNGEAAARAFYDGLLGLREVAKPAQLISRGGCWFQAGTVKVHLGVDPNFIPAGKAHPAFVVDDLVLLQQKLEAAGIGVIEEAPLDGIERRFVHDPFGNRIELMQYR
ncbi:VOC family protein [Phyllobacterium sp. UNC302MFCol5.2]|uniref:VOC family protein n=1 Tax=Phyllobacterium sp. UNC302MFCol5.2 TaxID=1449065 RepID=UPI0004800A29|nr:VOC family protein [Phyllobacterium sp. UNC302MFCol5.2]